MKDSHIYYPAPGWYWKWVLGILIVLSGGALMILKIREVLQ